MQTAFTAGSFDCVLFPGTGKREACILVINMVEHPLGLQSIVSGLEADALSITIPHWDDALTPWTAPGLYPGDADFGGKAADTLKAIEDEVIPALRALDGASYRHLAIAGYSLGGLFSLYAYLNSASLDAVASMSGSVWYEGWLSYMEEAKRDLKGTYAYLSIGDRENRAKEKILHCVVDNTEKVAEILQEKGARVDFHFEQGAHFDGVPGRVRRGLEALDAVAAGETALYW